MKKHFWKILGLLLVVGTGSYCYNYGYTLGQENTKNEYQLKIEEAVDQAIISTEKEMRHKLELEEGKDEILLVNKDNRIPSDYQPELIVLPDQVNRAAKDAYQPLMDMLAEGRKEGLNFEICSSYRDVSVQERLFIEDIIALMRKGYSYENAYAQTAKYTMPPGHSEHATGLAFDIVALNYQLLDERQEYTPESIWLRENCEKFGFILRYPKGKEEITQINFESWHFRYVGIEAATYIMENGITLEEYLMNEIE